MPANQNIYLVGPMGAGKTTIGRKLADSLSMDFMDSDHEIEQRTGASIPWIFDVEGEAGFRRREKDMIDELTRHRNLVLATGGGAVLQESNRQILSTRGTVIYLSASIDQLLNRTRRDKNRPLLQTENPQAKLEELMKIREPLYREVADLIIDTGQGNVQYTVNEIIRQLKRSD